MVTAHGEVEGATGHRLKDWVVSGPVTVREQTAISCIVGPPLVRKHPGKDVHGNHSVQRKRASGCYLHLTFLQLVGAPRIWLMLGAVIEPPDSGRLISKLPRMDSGTQPLKNNCFFAGSRQQSQCHM